ncbi:hypothetical protein Tco_1379931 [Tanacetum coccineum]
MKSSNSNSEKSELELMQHEERQSHSKCMAWFKELKIHLETLHNNKFSVDFQNKCWQKNFKDYTRCEPETYRRNLLRYLNELDKLIDKRVLKYEELRMKEREVQAIKEIEKRLKEREIQQQESLVTEGTTLEANLSTDGTTLDGSLVTEGTTLEASLVTKGISLDASLVAKQSTIDSTTSSEQQNESNGSRKECSRLGNEKRSYDNESKSSGNDADDDIGPSYDSDTVTEVSKVHHDIFENMFVHGIQNHKQPESIPDTYVVNENDSNIISDIPNMD